MMNLIKTIDKKINSMIVALAINGVLLIILGLLIVWTDFVLRLTVGIFVLLVDYSFLYGAYKVWSIKDELKKYLNLK